jgi:glycosyltransferase involved in cell wall biosynthesis
VHISLDATYSLGPNPTGVGVYSREILFGMLAAHPEARFSFCYRPKQYFRGLYQHRRARAEARFLTGTPPGDLFHALNQRVDNPGRRTVCTFHDLFVMTSEYSSPEFRARFTQFARDAAARSDLLIAVSRFTASQIEALLKVDPSRIRVIPHGVHQRARSPVPREKLVLSVGAIQTRKNTARLVRAFERMPKGWRLVLAGSADGFGAAEELKSVEQSQQRAAIDVLGYVATAELESLYRRASLFAFPSLDEGFGMPILDAMAHGVPVITSNVSAMPEVAGDAALLVDPLNQEAIADALIRLASDDVLRADLTQRGLDRAREFTWSSAVEQTWSVYTEIA